MGEITVDNPHLRYSYTAGPFALLKNSLILLDIGLNFEFSDEDIVEIGT